MEVYNSKYYRECPICGKSFITRRTDKKYCSKKCRSYSSIQRKRERYRKDTEYREKRKKCFKESKNKIKREM